jgi:sensor domain CHASE-containing protein
MFATIAHFMQRSAIKKTSLILLPVLLFVFGILISYRLSYLQFSRQTDGLREHIGAKLDSIRGDLSRELYAAIHLTEGISGLVAAEGDIDKRRFEAIAGELIRHNQFIRNIALAPNNVIRFVYPLEGNERALGLDYMKVPDQRDSVLRAITERRMVVAGPLDLVQGGIGIIGRTPIFVTTQGDKSGTRRYWGISATVLDFQKLIKTAGLDTASSQMQIALRGRDGMGKRSCVLLQPRCDGCDSSFRQLANCSTSDGRVACIQSVRICILSGQRCHYPRLGIAFIPSAMG